MFSKTKNRTFNYQPRFLNKNGIDVASNNENYINSSSKTHRVNRKSKFNMSLLVLVVLLATLLIGIYYLGSFKNE